MTLTVGFRRSILLLCVRQSAVQPPPRPANGSESTRTGEAKALRNLFI